MWAVLAAIIAAAMPFICAMPEKVSLVMHLFDDTIIRMVVAFVVGEPNPDGAGDVTVCISVVFWDAQNHAGLQKRLPYYSRVFMPIPISIPMLFESAWES